MQCQTVILLGLLAVAVAVPKPPKKFDASVHGEKSKFRQHLREKLARHDSYSSYDDTQGVNQGPPQEPTSSYMDFEGLPLMEALAPPPPPSTYTSYRTRPNLVDRIPPPEVLEALRKMIRTRIAASSYVDYDPRGGRGAVAPPKEQVSSYVNYETAGDSDALEIPKRS